MGTIDNGAPSDLHEIPGIEDLVRLLRLPSYAGNDEAKREAAKLCATMLEDIGFATRMVGSQKAPILIATRGGESDGRLMFFTHYDVVHPGEASQWDRDPFSPHLRGGKLYARGVSDHKACLVARIAAVRNLLRSGELPVGLTFLIDGEEEIGSPSLRRAVIENRELLSAEGGLYSGAARTENGSMLIRAGMKGSCGIELSVDYSSNENHPRWASILPSPSWRLVAALASLVDGMREEVLLPDFGRDVHAPDSADERALAALSFDRASYLRDVGYARLRAGAEEAPLRSLMFTPAIGLTWLSSGSSDANFLPGSARARLDIRLVPDQGPLEMFERVREHLSVSGFDDVTVTYLQGGYPYKCPLDHPVVTALAAASREVGGGVEVHSMSGGSGPGYLFPRELGYALVQDPGCSWSGSNDHGPNENIKMEHYVDNINTVELFIRKYTIMRSKH